MPLTDLEFATMRQNQFCDNPKCTHYGKIGEGNLSIHSRRCEQVCCNKCKEIFSIRKGTMFTGLKTPIDKIVQVLTLVASGMGQNQVCKSEKVCGEAIRAWIVLAAEHTDTFTVYMQKDMKLEQLQIDEFWSFIRKKNKNLTEEDLTDAENDPEIAKNQGDAWTFVAVIPDSSFIHAVHTGDRNIEEATTFVEMIKDRSNGEPPLISSDDWFYEGSLLSQYGVMVQPEYKGRGRYPHAKLVPMPGLKYVQVQKKRDKKGKLIKVNFEIIYGTREEVEEVFNNAKRCKTINTVYVESRNGKYRLNNARLIRQTLCHSKKAEFHAAQIKFTTQVMNYTRTNDALKVLINPNAGLFEKKYMHRTPAMAQGLTEKTFTIKEMLMVRVPLVA
jgi:hypothetical protein